MKRKVRVGFDFDGVVAYNPFRVVRAPLAFVKRNILGVKKLKFWYPKSKWQQIFWIILHESSIYPAKGIDLLRKMVADGAIEAHLITGRYSFLDNHLSSWLKRHKLNIIFKTINLNKGNEQPHLFKARLINKYKLDYFIEDNLDIVTYLHGRQKAQIFWIFNVIDRYHPHPHKYPYLKKALEEIDKETKTPAKFQANSYNLNPKN